MSPVLLLCLSFFSPLPFCNPLNPQAIISFLTSPVFKLLKLFFTMEDKSNFNFTSPDNTPTFKLLNTMYVYLGKLDYYIAFHCLHSLFLTYVCFSLSRFPACFNLSTITAVYDITIGYKHRCPTFFDNACGVNPSEVHIHVHRIPVKDIPTSEDKTGSWLLERFCLKDKLLSDFYLQGHFPRGGTENDLSMVRCLMNCFGVIAFTSLCTFFTLFSSGWFKMYVSLVCVYLTSATYFHIRPCPLFAM